MPAIPPTGARRRIVLYFPRYAAEHRGSASRMIHLPLSLLSIAGLPLRDGFDVVLVDGSLHAPRTAHRMVVEACRDALLFGTTGILGHQVLDAHRCASSVRAAHPRLRTILGGWFAGAAPRLQLSTGLYDAIALGQGELTFLDVARAVDAGEPLDGVPGLALLRDGEVVRTAPRDAAGWDRLTTAPWELIDFDAYREHQRRAGAPPPEADAPRPPWLSRAEPYVGIGYHASYGCPERCAFCCSPAFTDLRWKAMTAERMLDDLEELHARWGFGDVGFYDASWGASEKRAREFAVGMLSRGLRFGYRASLRTSSILRFSEETLDLLAGSGLHTAEVGAETGSAEMIGRIGKHLRPGDELAAARALNDRGIAAWMSFQIGFPGESEGSMLATLDRARAVHAACAHAHARVGPFVPLPGTAFWERALAEGFAAPHTLAEWGDFDAYARRSLRWPRIPARILRRCERLQRDAALSRGAVRGKIGWWERRARLRLHAGEGRFATLESRALSAYLRGLRLWRRWVPSTTSAAPPAPDVAPPWERGNDELREHVLTPRASREAPPTLGPAPPTIRSRIGAAGR